MSVNGVTNSSATYQSQEAYSKKVANEKTNDKQVTSSENQGVVYESSAKDSTKTKMTDYSSIVANLKKEVANRNEQLQNLVNQLLNKQSKKFNTLADMYKNLEVDPETVKKAEEEISDDGYWGVEQTSDRLVSMAQALSGGDPDKADELISAMKKGFKQATKAWGEDLPDICSKTIDAAVKKMENWRDGVTETE